MNEDSIDKNTTVIFIMIDEINAQLFTLAPHFPVMTDINQMTKTSHTVSHSTNSWNASQAEMSPS